MTGPSAAPGSIQELNALPPDQRDLVYALLVPAELRERLGLDAHGVGRDGEPHVRITASRQQPWARVEVRRSPEDRDPVLLIDVETSSLSVPKLAFVQITDPASPRYGIDRDPDGQDTLYGTMSRNLAEEARALEDGLAPGQTRRGLRLVGRVLACMEDFCRRLGTGFFLIEPLFYHSAILYERRGCGYLVGRERMEEIHRDFGPGGALLAALDDSTPFRRAGAEKTVRGRSWAIHDGILGHVFGGVHMYKATGRQAQASSFPDGVY
jgi:acetoin utilization protein AcuC